MGTMKFKIRKKRYCIIDQQALLDLTQISKFDDYQIAHREWLDKTIAKQQYQTREKNFSEVLAIGSEDFLQQFKSSMSIDQRQRKIVNDAEDYVIKEPQGTYETGLEDEMDGLSAQNTFNWEVS